MMLHANKVALALVLCLCASCEIDLDQQFDRFRNPDADLPSGARPTFDAAPGEPASDAAPSDAATTSLSPDAGDGELCPEEMIYIPSAAVCIDRYEASQGNGGAPLSIAGVLPWAGLGWADAGNACQAAGKRLCEEDEWYSACSGPQGTVFPYGDSYEDHTCNGNAHGVYTAVPTGSMSSCEGGYPGLFDMSGNVREWINVCSGTKCSQAGGSYSNQGLNADHFLQCGNYHQIAPEIESAIMGFRCCLTP